MASDTTVTAAQTYALLADGTTVLVRLAEPADAPALERLYDQMSDQNRYLRFLGAGNRMGHAAARRSCRQAGLDHAALLAVLADEVIGVAEYEATAKPGVVEVACAVADRFHHRGVATLLLEHLAVLARDHGISSFTADTLAYNHPMLSVFSDMGLRLSRRLAGGVVEVTIPLAEDERYLNAVADREQRADVHSLTPLLRPRSVAVVGVSRRPGSVGRAILANIRAAGFTGPMYALNPHAMTVEDTLCYPSVADLPEVPDLAVLAVPARAVPGVAEECGIRGVRALVVVTAGLDAEAERALRDACRRHGMRLIGPNCLGIVDTDPAVQLNATFAASPPAAGAAGVAVQSGGVGIALLEHLSRLGVGVSTFASMGDKYDVSGNDMLQWWAQDGVTELAVLYLESFGNPRKFARIARRVARTMPVLTVRAGRSEAGRRAAASHTAAAATPAVSQDALFTQAGVIATDTMAELIDAAALLAFQPLPTGPRVAVVSNAGGAGVLAADACSEAGLTVPPLPASLAAAVAALLPAGSAADNPVDATAAVSPERLRATIDLLAGSSAVDAVIVLLAPTALGELGSSVTGGPGRRDKPVVVVRLDQATTVDAITGTDGASLPSFADPGTAARALAHAQRYAQWRASPAGQVPPLPDVRTADAVALVERHLAVHPGGGWLAPDECAALLDCYALPRSPQRLVTNADEAVAAAEELGLPAVLKAQWPGLVHKTDSGALRLGLASPDAVRAAYEELERAFGQKLTGALVQPMAAPGLEVIVGMTQDPVFGPLVLFGLGGIATEVLADHGARLTPLTDLDAAQLVRSIRTAPLLFGHRGQPAVDVPGLEDLLLRLSRLAEDLPQVAELDLNPVIARADGVVAVDARVRVLPADPTHPYLRRLR